MAAIQDFGGKIGGAAKDRSTPRGPRSTPNGETAGASGRQAKPLRFAWYIDRKTGAVYAVKDGDRAHRRLREFPTGAAAREFLAGPTAQAELEAAWEAAREAGNVTEEKTRGTFNRPRSGLDHRGSVDSTPETFLATFKPYGVEFGNWQTDRTACLNQTHDALCDLAGVVRMQADSLTFGGRLSLAFGARGHGKASAHYEPDKRVINLTKTAGAGCLAHEWFHAYDHQQGDAAGLGGFASAGRSDLWLTLQALPAGLKHRSLAADRTRSKRYWSLPEEILARAFEAWVRQSVDNDYLANILPVEQFSPGATVYPYPLPAEMPAVAAAFQRLFGLS
jgi:hypothetical protein